MFARRRQLLRLRDEILTKPGDLPHGAKETQLRAPNPIQRYRHLPPASAWADN